MNSNGVATHDTGGLGGRAATVRLRPRDVRPRPRRSPVAWIVAAAAVLMLADGAASVLAPTLDVGRPVSAPVAKPPAQAWLDIPNPLHLYDLSGSVFARLPLAYAARRRASGDERLDTLTYGAFDGAAPYLRLALHRTADLTDEAPDLLVALARLAATDALAVTRVGLPFGQMTRFGLFDTADITVQRGSAAQPCLGFRLAVASPVEISGLVCGGDAKPLDRAALGCMLDRIDLLSAGDDKGLRDTFVAAERRRTDACSSARRRPGEIASMAADVERR